MNPWKLVVVLAVAVVLALFIGFNLENKCEISFVFARLESVPVYMTVLISFMAGLVAALPFAFRRRKAKGGKADGKNALPPSGEEGKVPAAGDGAGEAQAAGAESGVPPAASKKRGKAAGKKGKGD